MCWRQSWKRINGHMTKFIRIFEVMMLCTPNQNCTLTQKREETRGKNLPMLPSHWLYLIDFSEVLVMLWSNVASLRTTVRLYYRGLNWVTLMNWYSYLLHDSNPITLHNDRDCTCFVDLHANWANSEMYEIDNFVEHENFNLQLLTSASELMT